jgi:glycosyltransferase involved in cell wall biosynthesis
LNHRVGIVVPTLGERPDYLEQCLKSIRAAGQAHIVLVAPKTLDTSRQQAAGLVDSLVIDNGAGLPAAINLGIESLPESVEYLNWLGDDDRLTPGAITACTGVLDSKKDIVMTFGACEYIDSSGDVVWENRSGQWAVPVLRVGPDLIPQPGALFRRSAFNDVGGLKTHLGWAFDFDLFIRLSKVGKLQYMNQTLSQFRWHPESLSVEYRKRSVAEASQVRVLHLPSFLQAISFIWEYPVRQATLIAGKRVTAKAQSKARTK